MYIVYSMCKVYTMYKVYDLFESKWSQDEIIYVYSDRTNILDLESL